MTVKFFSIYLQEIVLLTPSTVMIVSAVSTMVATFFSKIAERFTRCIGRVQTLILFRLGGVGTMVLLGLYSHDADHPDICHNATAPGHGHHNLMDSMDGLRYGQTVPGAPIFELGDQVSLGAIHEGTKIGSLTVWQLCVIALFVSTETYVVEFIYLLFPPLLFFFHESPSLKAPRTRPVVCSPWCLNVTHADWRLRLQSDLCLSDT